MRIDYKENKNFTLSLICLIIFGCAAGLITKSEKYAIPEKTWETYKEAIMKGNIEASFNCFAEYVRDMAIKKYNTIGLKEIQERVRTIKGFQLIGSATINNPILKRPVEYKEYRIVTEKGAINLFIFFVKIDGEWKIEQLPSVMDLESFQP